jgi:hypothetical protein
MVIRFIRKTTIAVLVIAVIDAFIVWIFGSRTINGFFTILTYSGVIVFFLSILTIGRNRLYYSDSKFTKIRTSQSPFEETILSITMAAILIFSIGQLSAIITF